MVVEDTSAIECVCVCVGEETVCNCGKRERDLRERVFVVLFSCAIGGQSLIPPHSISLFWCVCVSQLVPRPIWFRVTVVVVVVVECQK